MKLFGFSYLRNEVDREGKEILDEKQKIVRCFHNVALNHRKETEVLGQPSYLLGHSPHKATY